MDLMIMPERAEVGLLGGCLTFRRGVLNYLEVNLLKKLLAFGALGKSRIQEIVLIVSVFFIIRH